MSESRHKTGNRRRFPPGDPRSSEYQQEMTKRRQADSVAIRKQRKEERLWRRRQREDSSGTTVARPEELLGYLNEFLKKPNGANLSLLQTHMAASPLATNTFLQRLLEGEEEKCRVLVSVLTKLLQDYKYQYF